VGVTRRPRGARRGSPDPAGLPDRQVSRARRRPRFQRCSCLLSLLQTKETYRSSIWAGSGDPRPARDFRRGQETRTQRGTLGGGQETRAQRGTLGGPGNPRPARDFGRGQETRAQRGTHRTACASRTNPTRKRGFRELTAVSARRQYSRCASARPPRAPQHASLAGASGWWACPSGSKSNRPGRLFRPGRSVDVSRLE
jgi:hypothetical protein